MRINASMYLTNLYIMQKNITYLDRKSNLRDYDGIEKNSNR